MVQLYQLNIVHCLFHWVDRKFRYSLNFCARNRRRLKKWKTLLILSLWLRLQCSGVNDEESSHEEEAAIVIEIDQSKQFVTRRLISQNWSVTLTVVVKKKKTSTLTLILMNQLTWPLINFVLKLEFQRNK